MKKVIVFSVLLFSVAVLVVAGFWVSDYGYVLITSGEWTFENSLTRSIVIASVPLIFLYFGLRALTRLWRLPTLLRGFMQRRKSERARRNIIRGLIELTEGHWHKAELVLTRDIENADTPLLNYLLDLRIRPTASDAGEWSGSGGLKNPILTSTSTSSHRIR